MKSYKIKVRLIRNDKREFIGINSMLVNFGDVFKLSERHEFSN